MATVALRVQEQGPPGANVAKADARPADAMGTPGAPLPAPLTTAEIERALVIRPFNYRRNLVVANVSWGMLPWEADLLVCNANHYLYEVEIKTSIADLKRDRRKSKWHPHFHHAHQRLIRCRWFAMPRKVWEHKDAEASVPEHAGVIIVERVPLRVNSTAMRTESCIVRQAKRNHSAKPLTLQERYSMARLGALRAWK